MADIIQLMRNSDKSLLLAESADIANWKNLTHNKTGLETFLQFNIAELQLKNLRKNLDSKQLKLEITDTAKDLIVKEGYDPVYGARPLKRFIQSRVETAIAKCILRDDPAPGDTVKVDVADGTITASIAA